MRFRLLRECTGEALGTFVMVFIGCGAVGMAVILGWLTSLWQVAAIWGIGVTLAIMSDKKLSAAHLNPAVTLAMCLGRGTSWNRLLPYSISQLIGAILAGLALLVIFKDCIVSFEKDQLGLDGNLIEFLTPFLHKESAQMFGEFFPNQGYAEWISIHWSMAMFLEGAGAFILIYMIFWITEHVHELNWKVAAQVGLTVALLICIIAPFTQCGMNPARDLGPRMVAYFSGWGNNAFPETQHGALTVYVLGPLLGGATAGIVKHYRHVRKEHDG
jgi:glycerol uptake facilitator protein